MEDQTRPDPLVVKMLGCHSSTFVTPLQKIYVLAYLLTQICTGISPHPDNTGISPHPDNTGIFPHPDMYWFIPSPRYVLVYPFTQMCTGISPQPDRYVLICTGISPHPDMYCPRRQPLPSLLSWVDAAVTNAVIEKFRSKSLSSERLGWLDTEPVFFVVKPVNRFKCFCGYIRSLASLETELNYLPQTDRYSHLADTRFNNSLFFRLLSLEKVKGELRNLKTSYYDVSMIEVDKRGRGVGDLTTQGRW
ncbi:hypothetical protein RRG08_042396 [Elysia crispata]|uniref:Uncharacterized protein n=1 Tax=Elysia crispata TaxID=231223 RepID=A0AAE0ZDX9_9GAST|nr:hypothetical protein RRG08_042396 [Elysia crispata]